MWGIRRGGIIEILVATNLNMPREMVAVLTPWLITEDWDFARQGVEIIARKDKHFNYGAGRVENQWCNGTVRTAAIRRKQRCKHIL
jgi:hypothetical protein